MTIAVDLGRKTTKTKNKSHVAAGEITALRLKIDSVTLREDQQVLIICARSLNYRMSVLGNNMAFNNYINILVRKQIVSY